MQHSETTYDIHCSIFELSMAALMASTDFFDMLGLPRELRDLIYAAICATQRETRLAAPEGLRIGASPLPQMNLLLVNRQISGEYKEQTDKLLLVSVRDHLEDAHAYMDYNLLAQVQNASELRVYLVIGCCLSDWSGRLGLPAAAT